MTNNLPNFNFNFANPYSPFTLEVEGLELAGSFRFTVLHRGEFLKSETFHPNNFAAELVHDDFSGRDFPRDPVAATDAAYTAGQAWANGVAEDVRDREAKREQDGR